MLTWSISCLRLASVSLGTLRAIVTQAWNLFIVASLWLRMKHAVESCIWHVFARLIASTTGFFSRTGTSSLCLHSPSNGADQPELAVASCKFQLSQMEFWSRDLLHHNAKVRCVVLGSYAQYAIDHDCKDGVHGADIIQHVAVLKYYAGHGHKEIQPPHHLTKPAIYLFYTLELNCMSPSSLYMPYSFTATLFLSTYRWNTFCIRLYSS